jgi:CshA-type fibril repeat protein
VHFRVIDAYGQARDATYTPQVVAPAPPPAPAQSSTGAVAQTQSQHVPVPAGGVALLIGPDGAPTTTVEVEGVGTYEIVPETGEVRFTPRAGFSGTPPVIAYRVTDAYGQTSDGTYAPAVMAGAATAPRVDAPPAPALPVASPCVSRRTTLIHWKVDRGTRVSRIAITLNGKTYKSLRGDARQALIDLHGRPAQLVAVRVTATGGTRVLATTRTYRTCTQRTLGAPLPTLHLRPGPKAG